MNTRTATRESSKCVATVTVALAPWDVLDKDPTCVGGAAHPISTNQTRPKVDAKGPIIWLTPQRKVCCRNWKGKCSHGQHVGPQRSLILKVCEEASLVHGGYIEEIPLTRRAAIGRR